VGGCQQVARGKGKQAASVKKDQFIVSCHTSRWSIQVTQNYCLKSGTRLPARGKQRQEASRGRGQRQVQRTIHCRSTQVGGHEWSQVSQAASQVKFCFEAVSASEQGKRQAGGKCKERSTVNPILRLLPPK